MKELEDLLSNENGLTDEQRAQIQLDIEKLRYTDAYYRWLEKLISTFENKAIFDFVNREQER